MENNVAPNNSSMTTAIHEQQNFFIKIKWAKENKLTQKAKIYKLVYMNSLIQWIQKEGGKNCDL